ncbi:MAG: hypothetical protein GX577_03285 [Leptolinea sp.]|nr:hypothetical protein [Leptolinea sp.]
MSNSTRSDRLLFWLLVTIFSTFFAEVTVGSAPLVFVKLEGWIFTLPVYGLHILVLAPLIIRQDRIPSWQALYLTGMLFGLYEAYMTKVLWSPPWNPEALRIGGVTVVDFIMLVLFWHPIMAFMIPLISTEWLLNLRPAIIPAIGKKWASRFLNFWNLCGASFLVGLCLGSMLGDPVIVVISILSSAVIIYFFTWHSRKTGQYELQDMTELLPAGKTWGIFTVLLMIDYVALGMGFRPEALPSIDLQVTIWMVYVIIAFLIMKARRRQPISGEKLASIISPLIPSLPLNRLAVLFGIAFITALLSSMLLSPIKNFIFLAIWGLGIPVGLFLFIKSIKWLFFSHQYENDRITPSENL